MKNISFLTYALYILIKNQENSKAKRLTSNAMCIIRNNIKANLKQKTKNDLNMDLGPKKHAILILLKLPKCVIFGGLSLFSCEGQMKEKHSRLSEQQVSGPE